METAAPRYAATLVLCRDHGLRKSVYETLAALGAIAAPTATQHAPHSLLAPAKPPASDTHQQPLDHRLHQAILAAKPQCEQAAWDEAYAAGAQLGLDAAIDLGLTAAAAAAETGDQTRDPAPHR
jgi:hypothetical protein